MNFKTLLLACPLAFLLASCGNKTIDLKFTVDSVSYKNKQAGGILDWSSKNSALYIEDAKFVYNQTEELTGNKVSIATPTTGSATFDLYFDDELSEDTDGTLFFSYKITNGDGKGQSGKSSVSFTIPISK